jgi:thymidylate synthase
MDLTELAFRKIYADVGNGILVRPRNEPVIEIEDYSYSLPPYARFANFDARKLKLDYIRKELLWYFRANPFDSSIVDSASIWQELPNADGTINSNYGAHVFGKTAPALVSISTNSSAYMPTDENVGRSSTSIGMPVWHESQFDKIIETLAADKDSRRASAVILNRAHLLSPKTKDYPCTYALNFRIRNNELKMSVHMRSQDAVFGMGNDAPAFSVIQEMVYVTLRDTAYPDLQMGSYHHTADSFHYYERHFEMVKQINKADNYTPLVIPKIRDVREVIYLLGGIHQTYEGGKYAGNYISLKTNLETHQKLSETLGITVDARNAAGDFSNWLTQGLS